MENFIPLGEQQITGRGFPIVQFRDVNGIECSMQVSSAAQIDAMWLGVDKPILEILATKAEKLGITTETHEGWIPYPIPDDVNVTTRMHLSREQVGKLIAHLNLWLEHGQFVFGEDEDTPASVAEKIAELYNYETFVGTDDAYKAREEQERTYRKWLEAQDWHYASGRMMSHTILVTTQPGTGRKFHTWIDRRVSERSPMVLFAWKGDRVQQVDRQPADDVPWLEFEQFAIAADALYFEVNNDD